MKKDSKKNVRLGLFVFIAFVLFTIGVYNIGTRDNMFSPVIKISVVFDNAQGLQSGNIVRYSGINVGSVDKIVMVNDSVVRVDMRIQSDVKAHMKKNALAYIASDGLVGDKIINIIPNKGASVLIEAGDFIQTHERVETDDMMVALDRTNQNVQKISENLLKITNEIADGDGVIANLISNENLNNDLAATLKNLKSMSGSLSRTSEQMELAVNDINEGKGTLGYLMKDSSLALNIDQLFADIDSSLIRKTDPILTNIASSSSNIKSLSATLDSLIDEIDLNEGVLGMLLKDSLVANQTNETLDEVMIGVEKFNENMDALKHNFLLRGYFRRKARKERKALKKKTSAMESEVSKEKSYTSLDD